jgi:hypothetical protein
MNNDLRNNMVNDPVYMNPSRREARDQALYQQRMTGRPQVVLQVNSSQPGMGFEFSDRCSVEDVLRITDIVWADGTVLDLTPLRGLER